jgi:hypothetical protein
MTARLELPTDWPATLPGLGPRRLVAYTACEDCAALGGRAVTETVTLQSRQIVNWTVTTVDHTWVTYGGVALCLPHTETRER